MRFGTIHHRTPGRAMALVVLEYLHRTGRRTGTAIRDDRAARCGSRQRVEAGIGHARDKGWIVNVEGYWQLTDEGRAELAGEVAA